MRAIITVLDSINQTTMPYNEFILYRDSHYKNEQQIVFLTGNEIAISEEKIPNSLEIHKVGKNPFRIRKELKKILDEFKKHDVRYIIHLHSIRGSFSTLLASVGLNCRKNTIYTIHSTFSGYRLHNKVLSGINALLANYVTCVSNTSYNAFPSRIKKIKACKMQVVHNGVNIERVRNTLKTHEGDLLDISNQIRCVYVARMVPLKNHKFLIDLLKNLPDNITFMFVGEEETTSVREYAINEGVIDRIEFTGLIPREEVYLKLVSSDIYISSSTLEGLPVSVLEGMFCGLPVVLSNIPQHKEVAEGVAGAQIVDFSIDKWSDAIKKLADMQRTEREKLGRECRLHVEKNFSLQSMHSNYDDLYKRILRGE